MNEILTAISLLLAFISVVYGQWIGEINKAIDLEPERQSADNKMKHNAAKVAFTQRAMPLAIGSVIIVLIFLPELISIAVNSYHVFVKFGIDSIREYSTMKTAFVAVFLMILYFAIHLIIKTFELKKKKDRLNPDNKD